MSLPRTILAGLLSGTPSAQRVLDKVLEDAGKIQEQLLRCNAELKPGAETVSFVASLLVLTSRSAKEIGLDGEDVLAFVKRVFESNSAAELETQPQNAGGN